MIGTYTQKLNRKLLKIADLYLNEKNSRYIIMTNGRSWLEQLRLKVVLKGNRNKSKKGAYST